MYKSGEKSSVFQAQKTFSGTAGAQVASSNQVLISMGCGVQRGGVGGGIVSGLTGKRPP